MSLELAPEKKSSEPAAFILVIDDDAGFAAGLQRHLERLGIRALILSNPSEAVQKARETQPTLILLDLCLDGGRSVSTQSSQGVLRQLKAAEETKRIPVVTMSGMYQDAETEVAFRAQGADSFFIKSEVMTKNGPFLRHFQALIQESAKREALEKGMSLSHETRAPRSEWSFPMDPTVLVIDDEEDTARLLKLLFREEGYRIVSASNGAQGLSRASTEFPDVVVLDLHMQGLAGGGICQKLRDKNQTAALYLPILIFTADDRLDQEVRCLEVGADDYLTKPVENMRLKARLRGLLRRRRFLVTARGKIAVGGVSLDCQTHELVIAGRREPVALTKTEAGIVLLLMSAMGRPIDHMMLHKKVCRSSTLPDPTSSTIKTHLSHIRHKIGSHGSLIETIIGADSYRFGIEAAKSLR